MPSHAQIDRWCLPTINLGVVNNTKPSSLTTTIIHNAHPASPPCHRHQRPPPPLIVTSHPQQPQHASTQEEQDKNAPSPLKNNATTPRHWMNERPPGAMSPTATWQPDDEQQRLLLFIIIYIQLSDPPSPPTSSDVNLGANIGHNTHSTPTLVTHPPQRPCHTPTPQERHSNAILPSERAQARCHITLSNVATR